MVKFTKDILPKGHRNRPGYSMKPKGLLFHTTNNWNKGAGDEMHAEYMENTGRVVSWHATVDKNSWTQHIPYNENAWHAGDGGKGHYNRNWLGLEIACEAVSQGQKLDKSTYENAVEVAAILMKQHGFTKWDQLQPHNVVYGKNCPHTTLFDRNQFKRDVFAAMKTNAKPSQPAQSGGNNAVYTVKKGDSLSEIAAKYNTTVSKLVSLNGIKNKNVITPGQKIVLPGSVHVVKKGQTLSGIAEMHDVSVDYLVRLNKIKNPNVIKPGQKIVLAGSAPAAKPKAPAKKPKPKYRLPNVTLRLGDAGQDVEDLQEVLTKLKFIPGKIDGKYGPKTADAVARFQSMYAALVEDGVYGPKTRKYMKKKL